MLLDQFGNEIKPQSKPDLKTLAVAPLIDSYRDYVTSGLTPERLAAIFKDADAGDIVSQAELFDQIEEKDSHIIGEKGKRINSILNAEYKLNPASEAPEDVKIVDFIQAWIDDWNGLDALLMAMQDAVGKGFACHEIKWDMSTGQALPIQIEFIEQKRFTFADYKTGNLIKYPLLLTDTDNNGIEIPQFKLIFHRYNGATGHPARTGIFRVCAWMFLFKNFSIKDWLAFCEVYGMPLRLGKYDPGSSQADRTALQQAVAMLGSDAAGIISKNTEIEFIESIKGSQGGDLYENLYKLCNREQSKAITGTAQSSDSDSPGSYASDYVKNLVRFDLVQSDAKAICETLNNQLIRPIVGFNFGWDKKIPKLKAIWKEKEDHKAKAETLSILSMMGLPLSKASLYEDFGIREPENEEDFLKKPMQETPIEEAPKEPPVIEENEEEKEQDEKITKHITKLIEQDIDKGIDNFTDTLGNEIDPIMESMIDTIKTFMMKAKSLEEIRDGIFKLFPDMQSKDIGIIMTKALLSGQLAGRYDV